MLRTITVERLIELLRDQDPAAEVIVSADYGDRCHTKQALPLDGEVEEVLVTESAYSHSGYAVDEDPESDDPTPRTYLLLS